MNKNYILIILLLNIAFLGQAQSKKKRSKQKETYALGISGGYFLHGSMFDKSENNFAGLNTFQVNIQKLHKSKKSGFSLGFLTQNSEHNSFGSVIDESRFVLDFNYNKLYNLMKTGNASGIYFGGFVGVIFDRGKQLPKSHLAFPIYTNYISLWSGPKVEYIHQLNSKLSVCLGGQLGLLEFGRKSIKRDDPSLPESVQTKYETYFTFAQRINFNLGINITL